MEEADGAGVGPRGRPLATSPKSVETLSPVVSAFAGEGIQNFAATLAIPLPTLKPTGSSQLLAAPVPPVVSPRESDHSRSSAQTARSDQLAATRRAAGEKWSSGGISLLSGSSIRRSPGGDSNPLLAAIRREVEACEARAFEHVLRVEQRLEQLCNAGHVRVERRLAEVESWQGEYEGRIAEMTGSVKGVKEQLPRVLRAVTEMDGRLWHSEHRAEEAWRLRASALEAQVEALVSESRQTLTAGEDSASRYGEHIRRLDASVRELSDTHNHRLHLAEASLEALAAAPPAVTLADAHLDTGCVPTLGQPTVVGAADDAHFTFGPSSLAGAGEQTSADGARRFAEDMRRLQVRAEEQEVRLSDLVEKVKWQESVIRVERDRVVRSEWDLLSGGNGIVGAIANGARVAEDDEAPLEGGFARDVRSHGEALDEVQRVVQQVHAFRAERQLGPPALSA